MTNVPPTPFVRRTTIRTPTPQQSTEYANKHGITMAQAFDRLHKDSVVEACINANSVDELRGVLMYVIGKLP